MNFTAQWAHSNIINKINFGSCFASNLLLVKGMNLYKQLETLPLDLYENSSRIKR